MRPPREASSSIDLGDEVPDQKHRSLLLRVADNLRSESMPPEGEPRPARASCETINRLARRRARGRIDATSGRVTIRRLNRAEYNNTIRDLIGLDLRPADEFPSDDIGYGFDNIAEVLSTPPILVEMYLAAADKVIGAAFRSPEVRERIMNPPVDTVPLAFRKYKPPVGTPREDKVFGPRRPLRTPNWSGSSASTTSCAPSPTGRSAGPRPTTS